jgi:exosortase
MSSRAEKDPLGGGLLVFVFFLFLLPYLSFFGQFFKVWTEDVEFSYGILIPPIVAYLLWLRRERIRSSREGSWITGLAVTTLGCVLLVLAHLTGNLLLCSLAFAVSAAGLVGSISGRDRMRVVAAPLLVLTLAAPIPSYVLGQLSWQLKVSATAASSAVLRLAGIPVYQDGNRLKLANYVMEIREACSGTRSVFALFALAIVLGITSEKRWWKRLMLIALAPALAVFGNVIRIVGTGLIAAHDGQLAANESLHAAWGVVVFFVAVSLLFGFQRIMKWEKSETIPRS